MTQTEIIVLVAALVGIGILLVLNRRLDRKIEQASAELILLQAERVVEQEAWLIEQGWQRLDVDE
jgi:hypothetical protein